MPMNMMRRYRIAWGRISSGVPSSRSSGGEMMTPVRPSTTDSPIMNRMPVDMTFLSRL